MLIELQKLWKYLSQNNSKTVTNEHAEEIPNEICISQEERRNYWWYEIKIIV